MTYDHRPAVPLAPDHFGIRHDIAAMLRRLAGQLEQVTAPEVSDLRNFANHLEELARRYYAADQIAVDQFLQLYCLDKHREQAKAAADKRPTRSTDE